MLSGFFSGLYDLRERSRALRSVGQTKHKDFSLYLIPPGEVAGFGAHTFSSLTSLVKKSLAKYSVDLR